MSGNRVSILPQSVFNISSSYLPPHRASLSILPQSVFNRKNGKSESKSSILSILPQSVFNVKIRDMLEELRGISILPQSGFNVRGRCQCVQRETEFQSYLSPGLTRGEKSCRVHAISPISILPQSVFNDDANLMFAMNSAFQSYLSPCLTQMNLMRECPRCFVSILPQSVFNLFMSSIT